MKAEIFAKLLESASEALVHAQGKRELRRTVLSPSPAPMAGDEVRKLRARLKASQAVFAHYLNVSTKLVQAWEADRRKPEGPVLVLLRLAEHNPALLLTGELVKVASQSKSKRGPLRRPAGGGVARSGRKRAA